MIVAIYAYENIYCGLHGMCNHLVAKVNSIETAIEWAKELSIDVMESYSHIIDEWIAEAEDNGLEPDSDEWDDYLNDCINENVGFNIWKVKENTGITTTKMNEEFYNDMDNFIKKYCEEL